jgi:hypothetical protein
MENEPHIYNDSNETTFTLSEVREICNGFATELSKKYDFFDVRGFWDYLKKSRFNERIRSNSK